MDDLSIGAIKLLAELQLGSVQTAGDDSRLLELMEKGYPVEWCDGEASLVEDVVMA